MSDKIRYAQKAHAPFFHEAKEEANAYMAANSLHRYATPAFWWKAAFHVAIIVGGYTALVSGIFTNPWALLACALTFGVGAMMLIFNVGHDAVHGTLCASRRVNTVVYRLCFVLLGVSGRLWAMRHNKSHHVFPNVDKCDIDIDENPWLRLSPNHERRWYQRWQHLYVLPVYCIVLLHTILYEDFLYLMKRELANMKDIRHPWYEYVLLFVEKAVYFTLVLVVPFSVLDLPAWQILLGYFIMTASMSLVFILTLVGTHFSLDNAFPKMDNGVLPDDWATHVLTTSLDWSPESPLMCGIFGGANAHVAHHLFPSTCHVHYAAFTPMIRAAAERHGLTYKETTLPNMLRSHFAFLKALAKDEPTALNAVQNEPFMPSDRMVAVPA